MKQTVITLTVFACLLIIQAQEASAASSVRHPRDFREESSVPGVHAFRRNKDYVHVILPRQGGRVRLLAGETTEYRETLVLDRKSPQEWWTLARKKFRSTHALANGQFFDTSESHQAALAFSVKVDGTVIAGYADEREYLGQKRLLAIDEAGGMILPYDDDPDSLLERSEPDAIIGLVPTAPKTANKRRARTFLATGGDGRIFVYSSPGVTQRYATRMLQHFGAKPGKILMLDGGGSTFLMVKGKLVIPYSGRQTEPFTRSLPQVLVIEAGK